MPQSDLHCPSNCAGERFEALNARLFVDRERRHVGHEQRQCTYICAECGQVAIDLAAVGRAMQRERHASPLILKCPHCGTEMLPPTEDDMTPVVECPACEGRFSLEEGMPRLHGTGYDAEMD